MNIGIVTANLGRLPILEIFCEGIRRLRRETGLAIPVVCAGDVEGKELCEGYGITHIVASNKPLTNKFNTACESLRGKVDYVMVMGSDDLIATKDFLRVHEECQKGTDLIGFSDVYMFGMDDVSTGALVYFGHTTVLGVGRTVKGSVLDCLDWKPWVIQRDRGIDTVMLDAVRPYVTTRKVFDGGFIVDLKTSWNLNPIKFWHKKCGSLPSNQLLWDNIGVKEAELIKQFLNKQK